MEERHLTRKYQGRLTATQDWWAVVCTVLNLRVPCEVENFMTSWGTVTFSTRTLLHGVSYHLDINMFSLTY
jgi:hypothetical protein